MDGKEGMRKPAHFGRCGRGEEMDGIRLVTGEELTPLAPCCRCGSAGCPWDRVAGKPICPDCQEALVIGEGPPLIERVESRQCLVCNRPGTLRYMTYPLQAHMPVEMDLCGPHVRALLSRRLDRSALRQLAQLLHDIGVAAKQVFLLHEAFYDEKGRPLQPVPEVY
jgi:hypothetical protein